jgi:hypothetical protein
VNLSLACSIVFSTPRSASWLLATSTNTNTQHITQKRLRRSADLAYFTENDTLYSGFQRTIMSEVNFAKAFLSSLDKKPIKLPADHVSDPKQYANQSPVRLIWYAFKPIRKWLSNDLKVHSASPNTPIPSPREAHLRPAHEAHYRDRDTQAYAWWRDRSNPRPRSRNQHL